MRFTIRRSLIGLLCIATLVVTACSASEVKVVSSTTYKPKQGSDVIDKIRSARDDNKPLSELYEDIPVIDIHNHAAARPKAVETWTGYGIDRIVLFGDVSEPSAQATDQLAWAQYQKYPAQVYPSFAGFPIYEEQGLTIVKEKLEQGYLNIGEVVAASTNSPVVSKVEWKSNHPNDGNLPQIYELAAAYKVPILLHIDPLVGEPIDHLEEALKQHPDTIFIFGHANAFNTIDNMRSLLSKHPNVYMDFYAGFTSYSVDSSFSLDDFVPLIEEYPDRFLLSTDSGFGLTPSRAASALFELIDLLSPSTALKVAYQNYERMIEEQPPTATQIEKITQLSTKLGEMKTYRLNKRMANELIFELEQKVATAK